MSPGEWVQLVGERYKAHRNPDKAVGMAAYMKNWFLFLGIQTPERERINRDFLPQLKPYLSEDWLVQSCLLLWEKDEREYQYCALDLLRKYGAELTPGAMPFVEHLIIHKSWWDTVDAIASHTVGALMLRFPELLPTLERYSTHENLWLRRTAILHQLTYKQETDAARLFRYCTLNASSNEFFIQKAIGWALREYSKTDSEAVIGYVQTNRSNLSNLSKREGLKKTRVDWTTV